MRELPLRSRYYHSEMDSYQIAAGEKYGNLKHSIVIFVCNFDLFAKNRSVYTFESICREDTEIHLQDKRKTIFININGSREDVPEELAHLLDYLKTKTPTDGFTERLEQRVLEIRRDMLLQRDYAGALRAQEKLDPYDVCCSFLGDAPDEEKAILQEIVNTVFTEGETK